MEGLYMGHMGASQGGTMVVVQGRCVCLDLCLGKTPPPFAMLICCVLCSCDLTGWLLPQEPGSIQRQQCIPQRDGGGPVDVWKSVGDKHVDLDGGLCYRTDPIESALD